MRFALRSFRIYARFGGGANPRRRICELGRRHPPHFWGIVVFVEVASRRRPAMWRLNMSKFLAALGLSTALAAAAALPLATQAQAAMSYGGQGVADLQHQMAPVEKAQFFWGGYNYCWYPVGWHGPGWYWCGYAWNNGYGWGGPYGWHGWYGRWRVWPGTTAGTGHGWPNHGWSVGHPGPGPAGPAIPGLGADMATPLVSADNMAPAL
jgi:hypothetical protein